MLSHSTCTEQIEHRNMMDILRSQNVDYCDISQEIACNKIHFNLLVSTRILNFTAWRKIIRIQIV